MYCWLDEWLGLSMEDVREYEAKIKRDLDAVSISGVDCVRANTNIYFRN